MKKDTVINYMPGARGEFLVRCLSNLDLMMTNEFKNLNDRNSNQIRDKIKEFFHFNDRHQLRFTDDQEQNIYTALKNLPTINDIQFDHWFCYFQDHLLMDLQHRYKIYPIVVEERYLQETIFFSFLKNNFINAKNIEDVKDIIKNYRKGGRGFHAKFDSLSRQKFKRCFEYGTIFYPPYSGYIELYKEINGIEPDLAEYERKNKQAQVPGLLNVAGVDIEIDIENYTFKIL